MFTTLQQNKITPKVLVDLVQIHHFNMVTTRDAADSNQSVI